MTPAHQIGPLKPFLCQYIGDDGYLYGITLYASDWEQIEKDWPEIDVSGQLIGTIDVEKE